MDGEEDNLLDVTEREVQLGNYKLNWIELNLLSYSRAICRKLHVERLS